MKIRIIASCCLMLMLGACGFTLQGYGQDVALSPAVWAVQGEALQQPLAMALHRQGAQVLDGADARIKVLTVQQQRDIDYINISGTADAYLLTLTVQAQAYYGQAAWGREMTVVVRRRLDYRDSDIHAKQREEADLWSQMREDAAEQLVRRLGHLKAL